MPMKKKKTDERKTKAASYAASLLLHLALLLIIGLLFSRPGGAIQGGALSEGLLPIGVVKVTSPVDGAKTPVAASDDISPDRDAAPVVREAPDRAPVRDRTQSPVVLPDKPRDERLRDREPQVSKTQPRATGSETGRDSSARTGAVADRAEDGATSAGAGGDRPIDTVGDGRNDRMGVGPGVGPFPQGSFGLARVPDCKKDDADNDRLYFTYEVTYADGELKVVFDDQPKTRFDINTIEMTRRIIEMDFNRNAVASAPGKTFKTKIGCRCGAFPKCELITK